MSRILHVRDLSRAFALLAVGALFATGCDSRGGVSAPEVPEPVDGEAAACTDGTAGKYPCQNVNLLSRLTPKELGGTDPGPRVNDLWGWTDPQTGRQYAVVGRSDGTAFVDVTDPRRPVYLGNLPSHGSEGAIQRDVKVQGNYAFVVAEANDHGLQAFDLTTLRGIERADAPQTFSATAHYDGFGRAHNLVLGGAERERVYAVGLSGRQRVPAGSPCSAGYHGVDISSPAQPRFVGCFNSSLGGNVAPGYTHDAQCVTYDGPDTEHEGKEICVGADETGLSVANLTDLEQPVELAARTYPDVGYAHQGRFSENQRYFFSNDEFDERYDKVQKTRTQVWDLKDLDDPTLVAEYFGPTGSSDHNLYTHEGRVYEANYRSGLRILDARDPTNLSEIAFFDVYPADDKARFNGAWSVYPFFEDGPLLVSSIGGGLFVLEEAP